MELFNLSPAHPIVGQILAQPGINAGEFELRHFPDGESYIRVDSDINANDGAEAAIFCELSSPDDKLLSLLFLADTLRDLGWRNIRLLTPYLPYMRQDIRFKPGEGITSRYFARILSASFDHLITIDPHLHRYNSLDEIYTLSSQVLTASESIAHWIRSEVPGGVIVGPDSESDQWVSSVARMAGCEQLVFNKTRAGDKDVSIDAGDLSQFKGRTPIMVDDIISTGRTMIEAAEQMVSMGLNPPVCIGVHALFADDAWQAMQQAPIERIVSCNTIPHPSNAIDITGVMLKGLLES
ncbi:ribose-phosphate pyrophosphokinase [Hahella ganghwensis]|uniref:ribose-phosphate pyrophosphokinase n=1 Tax=Hahella ganghwensis TaxID=286420 RepID=UPI0003625BE6|nr:ribose-phosphate pyrophosphokinase [Hahella ganghwensis]